MSSCRGMLGFVVEQSWQPGTVIGKNLPLASFLLGTLPKLTDSVLYQMPPQDLDSEGQNSKTGEGLNHLDLSD